ncbi:MAG: helix-turn-helix transcriptional regulator [Sporomusaceae bacterium]|nr:helix-turn-helix transcriptional regulator [Sporomusaceae bacterium]
MSLVSKIQNLCQYQDISILQLEKKLGLSRGAVYKWDRSSPSIDKVLKVAQYFGTPVDDLLLEDQDTEPTAVQIVCEINQLTEQAQAIKQKATRLKRQLKILQRLQKQNGGL